MELAKIETLLEAYFNAETTLAQEITLKEYFSGTNIAPHLAVYQNLFIGLKNAQTEVLENEISLPKPSSSSKKWWYSTATSVVIILGIVGLQFSNNQLTKEEAHALTEFNKTKKTLRLLSESFNKGTGELAIINQFTNTKNKILK